MAKHEEWYQQMLTPPEVYECTIRLGLIPETDHAQALAEMKDPTTGILIAQASIPHGRMAEWTHQLQWAVTRVNEWIEDTLTPF